MSGEGREELEGKLRVAFRILAEYGKALEREECGGMLMPESRLPAGRDAIKACILLAAAYRISNGEPPDAVAAPARVSYATLAHFVPDEAAQREAAFHDAAGLALGSAARREAPPGEAAATLAAAPLDEIEAARAACAGLEAEFDAALARILAEGGIR